jgi:hybrid polyketide synthase/nonribosomal peptide synthetase ACE1
VDKNQRIVPNGVSGEILIGGAGPCIGYLHQESLNKEKFVSNSFASSEYTQKGWTTAYRTFDRGHLLPDGALVIEGRLDGDTQIKLRGIRMELEDIENSIIETSAGRLNTVVVSLRGEQTQFLAAHVGFASSFESDNAMEKDSYLTALTAKLQLPQYMRPAVMVPLDHFPLTVHNKVDRKAINAMELPHMSGGNSAELSESQAAMRDIWVKVLDAPFVNVAAIGPATDFFLVGGNSVLMVKLQATIREDLGVNVPLAKLFEANTLGDAAALIESTSQGEIDWSVETSIDDLIADLEPLRRVSKISMGLTVALTGTTGYLGGYILDTLLSSEKVGHVHALAVRPAGARLPNTPKLTAHNGDLTSARLGLSQSAFDNLAATVDVVVHCGANRSFWDPYPALRAVNVTSTRWIAALAARKHVPVHFLSSGAVAQIKDCPPTDGSDGYVASKWASEEILEQAVQKFGLSVTVHRPTKAEFTEQPDEQLTGELARMIHELQAVPTDGGWNGSFTLVSASDVAHSITEKVVTEESSEGTRRILGYEAAMTVDTAGMESAIQKVEGYQDLEQVPAIRWLGRAKKHGFGYLVAAQDAVIGEGAGRSLR